MCVSHGVCAADKTGAKVVEDWICPSLDAAAPRPHDDDPAAGRARTQDRASAAAAAGGSWSASGAETDAGDGVEGTPLVGAYVGGTLAVLLTLIVATAIVSYYFAARS